MKRFIDITFSSILLLFLFPAMSIIACLIKLTSRGPVIYKGERSGRFNTTFMILKFRTMVSEAEQLGGPSTALNDPRITSIGRFLRSTKLDELPQLINVIKGEMSLVGPRPQVLYYTKKYTDEEILILSMRPGVTDLASLVYYDMDTVLGNTNVDKKYETEVEPLKNKLRVKYVKEASFMLDIRILIETFFGVLGIRNTTGLMTNL